VEGGLRGQTKTATTQGTLAGRKDLHVGNLNDMIICIRLTIEMQGNRSYMIKYLKVR
jgi:hypothetical protein